MRTAVRRAYDHRLRELVFESGSLVVAEQAESVGRRRRAGCGVGPEVEQARLRSFSSHVFDTGCLATELPFAGSFEQPFELPDLGIELSRVEAFCKGDGSGVPPITMPSICRMA